MHGAVILPSKKAERKLERKRSKVVDFLNKEGVEFFPLDDESIIAAAYGFFGKQLVEFRNSYNAKHGYFQSILRWSRGYGLGRKKKKKGSKRTGLFSDEMNERVQRFYRSYEWRKMRAKVLKAYGARCQCCGMTRDHEVAIHVDHIKPLRKYWHLRLEFENLQVLCEICNHGKGNWDETDWRGLDREYAAVMAE